MSLSDSTASSQKNESRKTTVPCTTAQASTTSPASPGSHEGIEVFTATATQAEAFLGGGRHDAREKTSREGPLQTSSPEMVLRATLTVPKEPKTLEDAAAAGKEPTPRNASEHYATTDSIDSTRQVPGNADIPEAACYATAQSTPHSLNPSISEHSSTFQTAEEINAVRGALVRHATGQVPQTSHKAEAASL
ncbi:hypothetical protein MRX96_013001 [Rhipicephalus microplus]